MKLAQFHDRTGEPRVGIVVGDELFDLRVAGEFGALEPVGSRQTAVGSPDAPSLLPTAYCLLPTGERVLQALPAELGRLPATAFAEWRHPLAEVELLAPVQPPSFRDFYAFEEHVRNARRHRGLEMVPEWYEAPAFYFSNTASILGPNAPVRKPPETQELDYELEIAVVIGQEGRDIPVAEADSYIAGFTILNDWSARDVQRREMKVGLGPAKGKDFATSLGPFLVTPDELEECVLVLGKGPPLDAKAASSGVFHPDRGRGKRYDLTMTAAVNGREYSRGNARAMHWTFAELIAHASRNTVLRPGDLLGSGTVGTGCIVEFPAGTYPWLQPGDVVRLEIEGLGVLENSVER